MQDCNKQAIKQIIKNKKNPEQHRATKQRFKFLEIMMI